MAPEATGCVRCGTGSGRGAGSGVSRCLLAEALVIGSWTGVVAVLARTAPSAIQCLADELLVRWKLDAPAGARDDGER